MADSGKLAILQNFYPASLRDLSEKSFSLILNLNSSPVGVESFELVSLLRLPLFCCSVSPM